MSEFSTAGAGGADQTGVSGGAAPQSTPQPASQTNQTQTNWADVTDDTPVRVPGSTEPIKYGDLHKRLQADYTKKQQALAAERGKWDTERQSWDSTRRQQEENLKRVAAELLSRSRQGDPNAGNDLISQLSQMQYIDGKTAAAMLRDIQENGIGQVSQAIAQRDQVIEGMYRQMQGLAQQVNQLRGQYTTSRFDTKISQTIKDLGLPPEATDLAKEIYLAYEGDDLDQEFPQILQNRWNQIVNILRAQDRAKVDAAKNQPFRLPGRGGNGSAGSPLGLKGNETNKEVVDFLWNSLNPGSEQV